MTRDNPRVLEIYKELAKEFKLPEKVIEEVCRSQFDYVAEVIKEGKYEPVRLHFLGLFFVKPERVLNLRALQNDL